MKYRVLKYFFDLKLGDCYKEQVIEMEIERAHNLILTGYLEELTEKENESKVKDSAVKKEKTKDTKIKK